MDTFSYSTGTLRTREANRAIAPGRHAGMRVASSRLTATETGRARMGLLFQNADGRLWVNVSLPTADDPETAPIWWFFQRLVAYCGIDPEDEAQAEAMDQSVNSAFYHALKGKELTLDAIDGGFEAPDGKFVFDEPPVLV